MRVCVCVCVCVLCVCMHVRCVSRPFFLCLASSALFPDNVGHDSGRVFHDVYGSPAAQHQQQVFKTTTAGARTTSRDSTATRGGAGAGAGGGGGGGAGGSPQPRTRAPRRLSDTALMSDTPAAAALHAVRAANMASEPLPGPSTSPAQRSVSTAALYSSGAGWGAAEEQADDIARLAARRRQQVKWKDKQVWVGQAVCIASSLMRSDTAQIELPLLREDGGLVGWLRVSLAALKKGKPESTRRRLSKWYGFRDSRGGRLLVEEDLRESRYAFSVPAKLLTHIVAERQANVRMAQRDLDAYRAVVSMDSTRSSGRLLLQDTSSDDDDEHDDEHGGHDDDGTTVVDIYPPPHRRGTATYGSDGVTPPAHAGSSGDTGAEESKRGWSYASSSQASASAAAAAESAPEPDSATRLLEAASGLRTTGTGAGGGGRGGGGGDSRALTLSQRRRAKRRGRSVVGTVGMFTALVGYLREAEESKRALRWLEQRVESLQEYVGVLERCVGIGAGGRGYKGATFKASTQKKDQELRFVATNLHLQELRVRELTSWDSGTVRCTGGTGQMSYATGLLLGRRNRSVSAELIYTTVTVGAFAAHVYGFKMGGIRQLLDTIASETQAVEALTRQHGGDGKKKGRKAKAKPLPPSSFLSVNQQRRGIEDLALHVQMREDAVLCQAASALVTAFARQMRLIQQYMPATDASRLLRQFVACGYLVSVESLLSTIGKELGMLGDFDAGTKMLSRFAFRLLPPRPAKQQARSDMPGGVGVGAGGAGAGGSARHRHTGSSGGGGGGQVRIQRLGDLWIVELRLWPVPEKRMSLRRRRSRIRLPTSSPLSPFARRRRRAASEPALFNPLAQRTLGGRGGGGAGGAAAASGGGGGGIVKGVGGGRTLHPGLPTAAPPLSNKQAGPVALAVGGSRLAAAAAAAAAGGGGGGDPSLVVATNPDSATSGHDGMAGAEAEAEAEAPVAVAAPILVGGDAMADGMEDDDDVLGVSSASTDGSLTSSSSDSAGSGLTQSEPSDTESSSGEEEGLGIVQGSDDDGDGADGRNDGTTAPASALDGLTAAPAPGATIATTTTSAGPGVGATVGATPVSPAPPVSPDHADPFAGVPTPMPVATPSSDAGTSWPADSRAPDPRAPPPLKLAMHPLFDGRGGGGGGGGGGEGATDAATASRPPTVGLSLPPRAVKPPAVRVRGSETRPAPTAAATGGGDPRQPRSHQHQHHHHHHHHHHHPHHSSPTPSAAAAIAAASANIDPWSRRPPRAATKQPGTSTKRKGWFGDASDDDNKSARSMDSSSYAGTRGTNRAEPEWPAALRTVIPQTLLDGGLIRVVPAMVTQVQTKRRLLVCFYVVHL